MSLYPTWLYVVLSRYSDYDNHAVEQQYAGVSEELALGLVWTKMVEKIEAVAPGTGYGYESTDYFIVRYRIQGLVVDVHHREWCFRSKTWDVAKNEYVGPSYVETPEVIEEGHGRTGWNKGFPEVL